jgi:hypothetical protein
MSTRRRQSIAGVAILLICGMLLAVANYAEASLRYLPLPPFGPVAAPSNLAVDQTNGDVYVAAIGENAVDKFEPKAAESYELAGKITGGETPQGAFAMHANEPAPVAISDSGSAIYVADPGHFVVDQFNAEGKYVCQFSGVGRGCRANPEVELGGAPTFGELTGVGVDSHGNVFVSDYTNEAVDEFTAAGADVTQLTGCGIGHPSGVAIDSSEVLYVQNYFGSVVACPPGSTLDPERSLDVATDPATNDVYVDHGSSVAVYGPGPANSPLDTFSVGAAESAGVAVNGGTQRVYVSDSAESNVLVFKPVTVPDVRFNAEPPEVSPTTATLHGEIDPEGTSEASYYFEYGPLGVLGATTPDTGVAEVNEFVPATATLSGLQPATTYGYRLVGTNSSGLLEKTGEGTCTTLGVRPEISAVEALDVNTTSMVFSGKVNPQNNPATYRFEYGETASYGQRLPDIGIAASSSPVSVEQIPAGALKPHTTYHYRLVAINSIGEAASPDETLTTTSNGTPPETPPVVSTEPAESIGQSTATLKGTAYPEGTATQCCFKLGIDTTYGTLIFIGEAGRETGAVSVSQPVTNLQPGTTYHYLLECFNAAGTTVGLDRAFTTSTFPQEIVQPATPGLVPIPIFPKVKNPVIKHPKKKKKPKKKKGRKAKGARAAHPRRRR